MSKPAERVLVFGQDMRIFLAVVRSRGRAGKQMHAAPSNWHSPTLQSKYACAMHRLPALFRRPERLARKRAACSLVNAQ